MRRNRSSAFTLIELLVVIAIVAILAAMLLPALEKARRSARIAVCTGYMRQHGMSFGTYQINFNGYYPLFGGRTYDYGPWEETSETWAPWAFKGDAASHFFEPGNTGKKMKQCPSVDWSQYGPYTFINPSVVRHHQGMPGYNFYTGRKLHKSTHHNLDTIRKRNDPAEILMTDQLERAAGYQNEDHTTHFNTRVSGCCVPWFNPHAQRTCLPVRKGTANQLTADGSVANVNFEGPVLDTISWHAQAYAVGERVYVPTTRTDGPWFRYRR